MTQSEYPQKSIVKKSIDAINPMTPNTPPGLILAVAIVSPALSWICGRVGVSTENVPFLSVTISIQILTMIAVVWNWLLQYFNTKTQKILQAKVIQAETIAPGITAGAPLVKTEDKASP